MNDLDFEAAEPAPVAAPVELGDNPVDWGENDVIGTIDWETIPGYTFDQTDPIEGPPLDDQELAYSFWCDSSFADRNQASVETIKHHARVLLLNYQAFVDRVGALKIFEQIQSDLADYEPFSPIWRSSLEILNHVFHHSGVDVQNSLIISWGDCKRLVFFPIQDAALQSIKASAWQSFHLSGLQLQYPRDTYKICRSAYISTREANDARECNCMGCVNLMAFQPHTQTLTQASPSQIRAFSIQEPVPLPFIDFFACVCLDFDDRADECFYDLCWDVWVADVLVIQKRRQFGFESAIQADRPPFVPNQAL